MSDNIALFDMDGSLFDYDSALLSQLQKMASPNEEPLGNLWDLDRTPHMKARMDAIKLVPGFWRGLRPLEDGHDLYWTMKKMGFNCQILTKGPKTKPAAWSEKVECCQKYFGPDIDVHVVSDKGGFYGKVLFDDYPDYMLAWLKHRPRGLGIMLDTPYNKKFDHKQVVKFDGSPDSWRKVNSALGKILSKE